MLKVLLDNHGSLDLFTNEALEPNIRADRKASTGDIIGSQSGMSIVQLCYIPHVGMGFFN